MTNNFSALAVAAVVAVALFPSASLAGTTASATPKTGKELTAAECSACHMAYQAGFLPARSWKKITMNLTDHFGEDASLDEPTRKAIEDYLVANAADANGRNPWWLRAIPAGTVPMRITKLPWFTGQHGSRTVNYAKSHSAIATISNCTGCHRGAAQGYFDE